MFVDPNLTHNPSTGFAAPAAWGDQIRDDLLALWAPPSVRLTNSAPYSINDATETPLTFDTEHWDTHGMHTGSEAKIVVPTGWQGVWHFGATVHWQNNGVGRRRVWFVLNGTPLLGAFGELEQQMGNNGECSMTTATQWGLNVGDELELYVYQDWGSALNIEKHSYASPVFWADFHRGPTSVAG